MCIGERPGNYAKLFPNFKLLGLQWQEIEFKMQQLFSINRSLMGLLFIHLSFTRYSCNIRAKIVNMKTMMHENWLENTPSKMISIFMLRLVYKVDSDLFISKFPAEKKQVTGCIKVKWSKLNGSEG